MKRKMIASLFFLLPIWCVAQSQKWALYQDSVQVISASLDSVASAQLSFSKSSTLIFCFENPLRDNKRYLILMNDQRNTILKEELQPKSNRILMPEAELFLKANGQPFTIYLLDMPADPAKAALVRLAPTAIGRISWQ